MYIRRKSLKNNKVSVQIVSAKRVCGGKRKLVILKHIGTCDIGDSVSYDYLLKIAKDKLENTKYLKPNTLFNLEKSVGGSSFFDRFSKPIILKVGFNEVLGSTFNKVFASSIATNSSLKPLLCNSFEHSINIDLLKDLVVAKIAYPVSKVKTVNWLNKNNLNYSLNKLSVDMVYKFMDKIDEKQIDIFSNLILKFVKKELKLDINILFFDATTLHFETFIEEDFRKPGYSKVGKHNQPQLLIGLVVNKEGLPLNYNVFEGNTFDGNTIKKALEDIKSKFKLKEKEDVILVADSAMLSKNNIELIEKNKYKFILAHRKKSLNNNLKNQILDKDNYKNNIFEIQDFNNSNHRLISSYSEKRAKKDKLDRDKKIEKLKKKITNNKLTKTKLGNSKLQSKFIKITGEAKVNIDEDKVEEDAKWDGLKTYITNIPKNVLAQKEIIEKYNDLWRVEQAFRIYKNDLKVRPVFHYKKERIEAHLLISFIGLFISKYLEYIFKVQKYSIRRIIENLETNQLIILKDKKTNQQFEIKTEKSDICKIIYKKLKVNG